MTYEDDRRERYRKDLIKKLPIEVKEDSQDGRFGFSIRAQNLHNIN